MQSEQGSQAVYLYLLFKQASEIHKGDAKFITEEHDNKNVQPVSCFPLTGAFVTWSREACAERCITSPDQHQPISPAQPPPLQPAGGLRGPGGSGGLRGRSEHRRSTGQAQGAAGDELRPGAERGSGGSGCRRGDRARPRGLRAERGRARGGGAAPELRRSLRAEPRPRAVLGRAGALPARLPAAPTPAPALPGGLSAPPPVPGGGRGSSSPPVPERRAPEHPLGPAPAEPGRRGWS